MKVVGTHRARSLVAALLAGLTATAVQAQDKLTFLTSWRAQSEHGGYYQALAKGYYKACGLDLNIRQGGPGVDPKQLLVTGAVDMLMASYSDTVFQLVQAGFPAKAVMVGFQRNPQILMTHEGNGIDKLEDMKGKPIMIATGSRTTFWPFLRAKYGFTDTQIRPYSGQIGPWMADTGAIQQGLVTNEPFRVKKETGKSPKVFLLSHGGYQSYGSVIVVPQALIDGKPQLVQCFVSASRKGWSEFLADPSAALPLIRKDNPDNPDDLVANTLQVLKAEKIVEGGDGVPIGGMTETRWKAHAEMLAEAGLLPAGFDVKQVYTTQFLR
ncbi:MAG: ABC transporter substrate-binding protein [Burkholderiales bacterium]|nr:ABC transporter substrate-binding protein [Burkholderiales bacterium]